MRTARRLSRANGGAVADDDSEYKLVRTACPQQSIRQHISERAAVSMAFWQFHRTTPSHSPVR